MVAGVQQTALLQTPTPQLKVIQSVETGVGAMADADFAVTVLLETIWPIEGNDYAEPTLVEPWCATYATDPNAAILSVTEYLSSEPDIAAADPESVASATDEYLDGNCYLLDE